MGGGPDEGVQMVSAGDRLEPLPGKPCILGLDLFQLESVILRYSLAEADSLKNLARTDAIGEPGYRKSG